MIARRQTHGFSTLELLVALAILSVGLMALIDFRMSLLQMQSRQLAQAEAIQYEANALALLRQIKPAAEPSGRKALGQSVWLQWNARMVGNYRPQLAWLGRETGYRVALFKVNYAIIEADSVIVRGSVELIGRTGPDGRPTL
ncbi:MAG: prepilin-type N-terminal cleavage/methylation domain-containing protein [Erythrobacter sp.]|uniref:type IV pilus modification PilV family protein n=1 Tax=Erythrobacter sp. TaxID=1042 RepID=UPI002B47CB9D|nr:prepilin-type N-terminal cleavage/methylation domain-containing protein [Erythrobacter sp.]WRH70146.1 MAG: prepilin-type N-terminal cleavage/methylation domain-containing protein [Erythrobacter sp.]